MNGRGAALLRAIMQGSGGVGTYGRLAGNALDVLRELPADTPLLPRLSAAEQTNSSIVYGDKLVLLHRVEPGPAASRMAARCSGLTDGTIIKGV